MLKMLQENRYISFFDFWKDIAKYNISQRATSKTKTTNERQQNSSLLANVVVQFEEKLLKMVSSAVQSLIFCSGRRR